MLQMRTEVQHVKCKHDGLVQPTVHQQASQHRERQRTLGNVRQEKVALETRIGQLDRLTEFCGPNGAMMGQSSRRLGSFTEDLNRHLAALGYACNVALGQFEIRVISSTHANIGLPLNHLSESEQFRFGGAFQVALAMVTDLRFVVIDQADLIDSKRRRMLTVLLVNSGLDQAIVLATSEEPPPRWCHKTQSS